MTKQLLPILVCLFCILMTSSPAPAASAARSMKEGVRAYDAEKYDEALSRFEKAEVEDPDDPKIRYNAATTRYRTGDFESAAKEFEQVLSKTEDPKLQAKTYYNLGNTAFRKKDLKASSEFYRKGLSIAPEDRQAKENLEFVLKALEKQKKQEQQQQDGGKQKNRENQEQQKNQQEASPSDQPQDSQDQKKASQDQPTKNPQNQKEEQAKAETQNPASKEGEEKTPSQQRAGEEKEQKPPEGEVHEAGGNEKKQGKNSKTDARQGRPVEGQPLSPDEAERLLNSLSDDQRAYFREQAAREAPKKKSVVEDW